MEQTTDLDRIDKALGERIVALRSARGLKQKDVVRDTGLSQRQCTSIEHGRASPLWRTLVKIAAALAVPWTELVDFEVPHAQ